MIGDKTLARPYAKAAFEVACDEKLLDEWHKLLCHAANIVTHPELHYIISSPEADMQKVLQLLNDLLKTSNEAFTSFLTILVDAKRLSVLPDILMLFEEYKDQFESEITVEIISSKTLNDDEKTMFANALEKKFSRKIEIENTVDESLLGGAVIRAGDLVIDGSGLNALAKLKNYLKGNQVCN